jgi:hypothetical protein
LPLEKTQKKKDIHLEMFLLFHTSLFVISRVTRGVLVFLCWIFNFLFLKAGGAWSIHAGTWVASASFGRRVWHHSMTKPCLSTCLWKCHRVLFLLVWHVMMDDCQFVTGGYFFFLPSFLSLLEKVNVFFFIFNACRVKCGKSF